MSAKAAAVDFSLPDAGAVSAAARRLGFAPDETACAGLAVYLGLLVKWNRAMNLVGPAGWHEIFDNLVVDSLHLVPFLQSLGLPDNPQCRDLGAGAGLPGIALRLLWQKGAYVLVEAREKRALFLRAVLAACPLPGVTVFQGRAEEYLHTQGAGHLIVSRAFMPWNKVLELIEPYAVDGLVCVFMLKAPVPQKPLPGWRVKAAHSYRAGGDERCFWALERQGGAV